MNPLQQIRSTNILALYAMREPLGKQFLITLWRFRRSFFWIFGVFWQFLGFEGILVIFQVLGVFWSFFWVLGVFWSFFGFCGYFGNFQGYIGNFGSVGIFASFQVFKSVLVNLEVKRVFKQFQRYLGNFGLNGCVTN